MYDSYFTYLLIQGAQLRHAAKRDSNSQPIKCPLIHYHITHI